MNRLGLATFALVLVVGLQVGHFLAVKPKVDLEKCRVLNCGKTGPKFVKPRIIGGRAARVDEFPFHVAISVTTYPGNMLCGGNMINDRWIITTGECLGHEKLPVVTVDNLSVSVGITEYEEKEKNDIRVENFWLHPKFKSGLRNHNIALIKTTKSINESSLNFVNPICLPFDDWDSDEVEVATVAGFGTTDARRDSSESHTLRTTKVYIEEDSICENIYTTHYNKSSMICAGDPKGDNDTCRGDGGGPLTFTNENVSYILKAITAFGIGCGAPQFPAVYTKVSSHLEWACETMLANGIDGKPL